MIENEPKEKLMNCVTHYIGLAGLLLSVLLASCTGTFGNPPTAQTPTASATPTTANMSRDEQIPKDGQQASTPALSTPVATFASKRTKWSSPYVVTGLGGGYYVKSAPEDEAREGTTKGTTRIYRVRKDADELIDSYDWYAPRERQPGLVMGWSPIAGKIAVMRIHDEPAPLTDERVELSFYIGGKFLKSYTVKDLVALGANSPGQDHRKFTDEIRLSLEYKVLPCEQVPTTNDYRFAIQVAGDKKILFDILTGDVAPWSAGPQADAAVKKALDYLAQNHTDTSRHDMSKPETVGRVTDGSGTKRWRIVWPLKNSPHIDGGQLIVILWDSGKIDLTYGE